MGFIEIIKIWKFIFKFERESLMMFVILLLGENGYLLYEGEEIERG